MNNLLPVWFEWKPPFSPKGNTTVVDTGNLYVIHKDGLAVLARKFLAFKNGTYRYEKNRRIEAISIARDRLSDLIPETTFFDIRCKLPNYTESAILLSRSLQWFNRVEDIQKLDITDVLKDRKICSAIRRVAVFTLCEFFKTGKAHDFFCIFSEYSKNGGHKRISNLLIPRNIMTGWTELEDRTIFIDADWYVEISDTLLSGYSANSYRKRIYQGMFLMLISLLLFGTSELFNFVFKKP